MKEVTLNDLISKEATLTDQQKESLFVLVVGKCNSANRAKLGRRLDLPLTLWTNHTEYKRVYFSPERNRFEYAAGQDYSSEITAIRNLIIKG